MRDGCHFELFDKMQFARIARALNVYVPAQTDEIFHAPARVRRQPEQDFIRTCFEFCDARSD